MRSSLILEVYIIVVYQTVKLFPLVAWPTQRELFKLFSPIVDSVLVVIIYPLVYTAVFRVLVV